MDVLVTAIPGFANVGALILLVIYIYAYIGVNIFGKIAWNIQVRSSDFSTATALHLWFAMEN